MVTSAEIQQQRQQLTQQQLRAGEQRAALSTQQALRSQTRQQQVQRKEALSQVAAQEKELAGAQEQLNVIEPQVKAYEAEVKAYEEEQRARESVQTAYEKGMLWAVAGFGEGRERELAKEMIKNIQLAEESAPAAFAADANLTLKYGTAAEKARVLALAGLPSSATNVSFMPNKVEYNLPQVNEQPVSSDLFTQPLNIKQPNVSYGRSDIAGGRIGFSMGDVSGDFVKPGVVADSGWTRFTKALGLSKEKGKNVTQIGNKSFVEAAIPTKTIISPERTTFQEYKGEPPSFGVVFKGTIISPAYNKIKDKKFFGKPIWAVVQGTPTFRTTIKDGAIVPKDYVQGITTIGVESIPQESGRRIQNTYDTFFYGKRRDISKPQYDTDGYITKTGRNIKTGTITTSPQEELILTKTPMINYESPTSMVYSGLGKVENVVREKVKPEIVIWDLNKGEARIERKESFWRNAIVGTTDFLLPNTPAETVKTATELYLFGKAFTYAPRVMLAASTTFGGTNIIGYNKSTTSAERESAAAGVVLGFTPLTLKALGKLGELSFFGKKPYQVTPTPEMEKSVQPFSRQRATLLLKDSNGKYILARSKGGEIISIGGGIEKGQTPKKAALTELKQETGLTSKDILNFKFAKKVVTPEETHYIFTGTIKNVNKIRAASDIKSIIRISPDNPFIVGVTGQTANQPITRLSLFPLGKVRSYEAGLINYLETGKKPTWLAIDSQQGTFFLGTQSRYNVPYSAQKQYLKQDELLLAHGTTTPAKLRVVAPWKKEFKIEGELTRRGQAEGMYVQPPISGKGISREPYKIFYHGTKGDYAKLIETQGLKSGDITRARTALRWERGNIYLTDKPEIAKFYAEMGIDKRLGLKGESYQPRVFKVGLTKEQMKFITSDPLIKGEYIYRGKTIPKEQVIPIEETFVKSQPGYIGLSYLGFQTSQSVESLSIKIGWGKKTAYLYKESPKRIVATPKTYSGMESEFIIPPESGIVLHQIAEIASIGFKRVFLQPAQIVAPGTIGVTKTIAMASSEGMYKYITPPEKYSTIVSLASKSSTKESSISKGSTAIIIPSSIPSKVKESYTKLISVSPSTLRKERSVISEVLKSEATVRPSEIIGIAPKESRIYSSKSRSYVGKSKPVESPSKITSDIISSISRGAYSKSKRSSRQLIEIFQRRRGKDIKFAEAFSAKEAGKILTGKLKTTLAASGFAKESRTGKRLTMEELGIGGREFRNSLKDFTRVVQRKGGKEGGTGRLSTSNELGEIMGFKRKKARRTKWL